jgi:hypothetical protein
MDTEAVETAEPLAFSRRFVGYDTREVDEYVARLTEYAHLLEHRAVEAEEVVAAQTGELLVARERLEAMAGGELTGRLAEILSLANEEAADILARAHAEEHEAHERASATASATLAKAAEECRGLERHLEALYATRDALIDDLRNLGARITQAAEEYRMQPEISEPESEAESEREPEPEPDQTSPEQPAVFDAEADATTVAVD